jgi:hypothetical protein
VARHRGGGRRVGGENGGWHVRGEDGGRCAGGEVGGASEGREEGGALEGRMEGGDGLQAALHERSVSMRDLTGRKIERERGRG